MTTTTKNIIKESLKWNYNMKKINFFCTQWKINYYDFRCWCTIKYIVKNHLKDTFFRVWRNLRLFGTLLSHQLYYEATTVKKLILKGSRRNRHNFVSSKVSHLRWGQSDYRVIVDVFTISVLFLCLSNSFLSLRD